MKKSDTILVIGAIALFAWITVSMNPPKKEKCCGAN